jgi:hypothetical protein
MLFSDSVLLTALFLVLGFLAGFFIQIKERRTLKKRLHEMERDMLSDHAEILKLHQEKVELQQQLKESKIPVITMNKNKEANTEETLTKQAN